MPRDIGTGLYHYPEGTPGNPAQTIFSTRYNTFINDLANTLNQSLPINMGGTGADNAAQARDNLDAERAGAQVTNYDSHVWEQGSFYSMEGATGGPLGTVGLWSGICHKVTDSTDYIHLEATQYGVGGEPPIYHRTKNITWGPWTSSDDRYVDVAGDTMTGNLKIKTTGNAVLTLEKATGFSSDVYGQDPLGRPRWLVRLGNEAVESSGNVGSDFAIVRAADDGSLIDAPLSIIRSTGKATFAGAVHMTGAVTAQGTVTTGDTVTIVTPDTSVAISAGGVTGDRFRVVGDAGAGIGTALTMDTGNGCTYNTMADHRWARSGSVRMRLEGSDLLATLGKIHIAKAGFGILPPVGNAAALNITYLNGELGTAYRPGYDPAAAAHYPVVFYHYTDVQVGNITVTGSTTAFNTSSDAALKEDLKSFDAGNIIDNTNVYDFRWKNSEERAFGVIAQQAVEVYPLAVTHVPKDEKAYRDEWWGVDYSKYVPVLLQELKALRARVAELEGKAGIGAQPA